MGHSFLLISHFWTSIVTLSKAQDYYRRGDRNNRRASRRGGVLLTISPEIKIFNMQKTPKPECKMTQNRFRELLKLSRLIKILSF